MAGLEAIAGAIYFLALQCAPEVGGRFDCSGGKFAVNVPPTSVQNPPVGLREFEGDVYMAAERTGDDS